MSVLSVTDVMNRYGYSDRRAARRVMDTAGSFKVGAHLYIHSERLIAYEESLIERRQQERSAPNSPTPSTKSPPHTQRPRKPLPPDWWRPSPADDRLARNAHRKETRQ